MVSRWFRDNDSHRRRTTWIAIAVAGALIVGCCGASAADARTRRHSRSAAVTRTPTPSIALSPAKQFVDGEMAIVFGSGFAPFRSVQWFQCAVNQFCDTSTVGNSVTQADGAFSAVWGMHRDLVNGSTRVNCSIDPCFVYAVELSSLAYATTPVSFVPGSPLYSVRVRTLSTATIDSSGSVDVKVAVECTPFADLSVDVRVEQRSPNGGPSATGVATYFNFSCIAGSRSVRTIPVQPSAQSHPFVAGAATAYVTVRLLGFGYGQQRNERTRIAIS